MAKTNLTAQRLRESLKYDPETGVFTWLISPRGRTAIGSVAGTINKALGYAQIGLFGHRILAHRLAWLYMTGEWPTNDIDHINGIRSDNRFQNLREATRGENLQNQRFISPQNTSGFMGVSWSKSKRKWRASVTLKSKQIFLGYFEKAEDAHTAYIEGKRSIHPFFTL